MRRCLPAFEVAGRGLTFEGRSRATGPAEGSSVMVQWSGRGPERSLKRSLTDDRFPPVVTELDVGWGLSSMRP